MPAMLAHANPDTTQSVKDFTLHPQTIELRVGDGSADVHLLLAGMAVAARHGLNDPNALKTAAKLSTDNKKKFDQLPSSCAQAANELERVRARFEADDVFPSELIDQVLNQLRHNHDTKLIKKAAKADEARTELITRHWHVG